MHLGTYLPHNLRLGHGTLYSTPKVVRLTVVIVEDNGFESGPLGLQ
jgi:hypothetical protein